MNDDRDNEQLVADLLRARATARLAKFPSQPGVVLDLDRAYQIGRLLHERLVQGGFQPVGRKIGFTNPATWEQFKVSQPIWAPVYEQTVHFAEGGRLRLPLDGMVAPRIEPEIVFKLLRPVPGGDRSAEELAGCVEWAALGFEIVDSHYPEWRITAADAVADFGVHAALVVGTPWRWDPENPQQVATILPTLKVALRRGTEVVAEGEGRNALGSPLLALGSLARVLAGQSWAAQLTSGEVITTGTLTSVFPVSRGERWRVEVSGAPLEPLELELEG
jgi:2-keto-4-pentenoate hydratase